MPLLLKFMEQMCGYKKYLNGINLSLMGKISVLMTGLWEKLGTFVLVS